MFAQNFRQYSQCTLFHEFIPYRVEVQQEWKMWLLTSKNSTEAQVGESGRLIRCNNLCSSFFIGPSCTWGSIFVHILDFSKCKTTFYWSGDSLQCTSTTRSTTLQPTKEKRALDKVERNQNFYPHLLMLTLFCALIYSNPTPFFKAQNSSPCIQWCRSLLPWGPYEL